MIQEILLNLTKVKNKTNLFFYTIILYSFELFIFIIWNKIEINLTLTILLLFYLLITYKALIYWKDYVTLIKEAQLLEVRTIEDILETNYSSLSKSLSYFYKVSILVTLLFYSIFILYLTKINDKDILNLFIITTFSAVPALLLNSTTGLIKESQ